MTDILIRGMEMPPTGNYFVMVENEPGIEPNVNAWKRQQNGELKHFAFCPLVEIPPHGRLIDADEAYDALLYGMVMTGYQSRALNCIGSCETIIPSNKEDAE